jgi:DNA-directed RNA polymerase specialized sigma24 family protein
MSERAHNVNGDPVELHAAAMNWRVKRPKTPNGLDPIERNGNALVRATASHVYQHPSDTGRVRAVEPHSSAWRSEFDRQATRETLEQATRAAHTRLREYARGAGADVADAEDLVMAALADTLSGELSWDPARESLVDHLCDAVRFRARNDAHRKRAVRTEPLDEDTTRASVAVDFDATRGAPDDVDAVAADVVALLRELARDDRQVLRLVDAFARGITARADVMHATQMSATTYHNARRRLAHFAADLPARLRKRALLALT